MSDLISRQAAIDIVNHVRFGIQRMAFEIIGVKLLELPSVRPERKRGKWIDGDVETGALNIQYTEKICSICGWSHSLVIPNNFCPNCGADMRGEKNDHR